MIYFRNDYSQGAHPAVLDALIRTNYDSVPGYGEDEYCERAREMIRSEIGCPDAAVYFIPGGTHTNLLMISAALRPHEAVIAAASGHINTYEAGAVEATGHKIVYANTPDGKLTPELIQPILDTHYDTHTVKLHMLYVSNSTEWGTIYTKSELLALRRICDQRGFYLYLDGARLGSALTAPGNDMTMRDIAEIADCFYIGGTKNGAMMGEALVIVNPALQEDMPFLIRQRGAMLAKGRLMGVQFIALFTDGLFYEIGRHANEMAARLREGLIEAGYEFYADSPSNQIFPWVATERIDGLREKYAFEYMDEQAGRTCIRFVTSWATTIEEVEALIRDMQ